MAKISRRGALAGLGALGLTACGGGGGVTPSIGNTPGPVQSQPPPPPPPPPGGGSLSNVRTILPDESGALYVLTADGSVYWYKDLGASAAGQSSSHAVSFANTGVGVRIATGWNSYTQAAYGGNGILYAVDAGGNVFWYKDLARNGRVEWAPNSGSHIASGWPVAQITGGGNGILYVVTPDGRLLWYKDTAQNGTAGFDPKSGSSIATGWSQYLSVFAGGSGILYAVDGAGQIHWFQDTAQNGTSAFASGSGNVTSHIPTTGATYGSDFSGNIYAVTASGRLFRNKDIARNASAAWDSLAWQEIGVGWDAYASVRGYPQPLSVGPGETVALKITGARGISQASVTIYRLAFAGSAFGTVVAGPSSVNLQWQPVPSSPWSTDHNWATTMTQTVGSNWTPGLYTAECKDASGSVFYMTFVVRGKPSAPKTVALFSHQNTWNAYNDWGGEMQYSNPNGTPLTFWRPNPYASPFSQIGNNHRTRAEMFLSTWLDGSGIGYDMYSDIDLHQGVANLNSYKAIILSTHPEYFTLEMRNALVNYLAAGGNLIYLGANGIYERVVFNSDMSGLQFRQNISSSPPPPRWVWRDMNAPEGQILGVGFAGVQHPATYAPYRVEMPSHPFFAGTGVTAGQSIGASGLNGNGASGGETDIVSSSFGSPSNVQVLAVGENPSGGANMAYYKTSGGGFVFAAGSLSFTGSLAVDPVLQQVVKNALRAATGG